MIIISSPGKVIFIPAKGNLSVKSIFLLHLCLSYGQLLPFAAPITLYLFTLWPCWFLGKAEGAKTEKQKQKNLTLNDQAFLSLAV